MHEVIVSGSGIYLPKDSVTNEELVSCYNQYITEVNRHHKFIPGFKDQLSNSDAEFIMKASGIKKRHVIDKKGILDPKRMHPIIPKRNNDQMSLQCEMSVAAAQEALINANKSPEDIDGVIIACSNLQRPYPAISIELQAALNINGFAYDMNTACSSASFGLVLAHSMIKSGLAKCLLMVNPEIYTGHLNFRDRRTHFIFGDGCSATIIERADLCKSKHPFRIVSGKLQTKFSNNIRNNFGFLNRSEDNDFLHDDLVFSQEGKKVKEEVVPLVINHIQGHLSENALKSNEIRRLWLHQANIHMMNDIAKQVYNRETTEAELPLILSEYGNTGASSVMITFHKYHQDLNPGDKGVICSFGAGYGVGSVIVEKL